MTYTPFYNRINTGSSLLFILKIILNWLVGTKLISPKPCLQFRCNFGNEILANTRKYPLCPQASGRLEANFTARNTTSHRLPQVPYFDQCKIILPLHIQAQNGKSQTQGVHEGGQGDRNVPAPPYTSQTQLLPRGRVFQGSSSMGYFSHLHHSPRYPGKGISHAKRINVGLFLNCLSRRTGDVTITGISTLSSVVC